MMENNPQKMTNLNLKLNSHLHMCLLVAAVAILENVPQGKKRVFMPAQK